MWNLQAQQAWTLIFSHLWSFNLNRPRFVQPCLAKPKNELLMRSKCLTLPNPIRSVQEHAPLNQCAAILHRRSRRFHASKLHWQYVGPAGEIMKSMEHPAHCNMERGGLENMADNLTNTIFIVLSKQSEGTRTHTHTRTYLNMIAHTSS